MATMTRQMASVLDELEEEFQALYTRDDFECKIRELRRAERTSARPSALAVLYQMLEQSGIPFEKNREAAYYEKLISQAGIPEREDFQNKFIDALFIRYQKYPKPEDFLKRTVDHLEDPEDHWAEDPLRLRILKQFIKYGDYLKPAGIDGRATIQKYVKKKTGCKKEPGTEEVLKELDDGVFEVLKTATRAQRRPSGRYGLIKTADDLASGKFRTGGATKKDLYLFAMVYNMTYYTGRPDEKIDQERDIETKLFRDYYTNNLMRFVTDSYRGRLSEYELDPSGQGINYKNFAEMVYLYYIRKKIAPAEKVSLSEKMIDEITAAAFKGGAVPEKREKKEQETDHYRKKLHYRKEEAGEEVLELSEPDFIEYLLENYNCDIYKSTRQSERGPVDDKRSEMELETDQNTAFSHYKEILRDLEEFGASIDSCNYGIWFTDVSAFKKSEHFGQEKYREFLELLLAVNSFFAKGLYVSSPEKVTRTSMLVAYYYYFNALHGEDEDLRGASFGEVFRLFKNGLDEHLNPSGYQPVSGRNLIDVIVIFSSYAYLND